MKKLILTAGCALVAMTGLAAAQTTTPATTPTTPPSTTSGGADAKPGLQRVDSSSLVMTLYTADPADVRASKLMGTNVYNLKDENIGEVSDLVIDNGKTIKAVVVSVGGFLGMGERDVAISPASIVLSEQRDGAFRLVVNTTKDDLKKATPFNLGDVDKAGPNAGKSSEAASMNKGANPASVKN